MGSTWFTGGVSAAPRGRIQFDFMLEGIRYRPTLRRPPSETNLRLAREHLRGIKQQIAFGTFSFSDEFPDYRYLHRVVGAGSVRLCDHVFDEFLGPLRITSRAKRHGGDHPDRSLRSPPRSRDGFNSPKLSSLNYRPLYRSPPPDPRRKAPTAD